MDYAHELTDKKLAALEKKLKKEYSQAYWEVKKRTENYFANFKEEDEAKRKLVQKKRLSKKDYQEWRKRQITTGEAWADLTEKISLDYQNADKIAYSMIKDHSYDVFALNYNYETYRIETGLNINTNFTLYDKNTVERLVTKNPKLLPRPSQHLEQSLKEKGATLWNKKKIQSVATQSIIQGDSIPRMANRIARDLGTDNINSAIRAARTMTTSAENGGRIECYHDAEDLGILMQKMWMATADGRTRDSHRAIDGEQVGVDEEFSNGLQFPGDMNGEPSEVYNCRCTITSIIEGSRFSGYFKERRAETAGYEEWKRGKNGNR